MLFKCFMVALLLGSAFPALDGQGRKLIISSDPEYPPISWRDPDHPDRIIGVAIEVVEMAFREIHVEVESKYEGPWERTLFRAKGGTVDIIAGVYLNEERKTYLDYIQPPLMDDPTVVFVMKGREFPFVDWRNLTYRVGGARIGDSFGDEVDALLKEKLTIEWVVNFEQLYRKLEAGRNQYCIYGLYPGLEEAERLGVRDKITPLNPPLVKEGIYIAFTKESPFIKYHDHLARKIREYQRNRIPEMLVVKYLKLSRTRPQPAETD